MRRMNGTSQTVITFTSVSKSPSRLQQHTQTHRFLLGSLLKTIHPEMHGVQNIFPFGKNTGEVEKAKFTGAGDSSRKNKMSDFIRVRGCTPYEKKN